MKRFGLALTSLLLLAAVPLSATDDPNTAKGFVAGQAYQFGDIAHVNLFNGNLNVVLPLGQPYKVNGALSYAITLAYSGNNWVPDGYEGAPVQICNPDCQMVTPEYTFFRPTVRSNAGLGWRASVGGSIATLLEDDPPSEGGTAYRGPDSADHPLSNTNVGDTATGYTSDGVFLRVTNVGAGPDYRDLEFPDGTIKRFQHSDGRLVSIRDRFGNQVTIDYSVDATGAPIWTIRDGVRTHTVIFEKLTVTQGAHDPAFYYVVKEIDLAAFGGAQAQYKFHYNPDSTGTDQATLISRRLCDCPSVGGTGVSDVVLVPLLTELTLPDGTSYKMSYNVGNALNVALEKDTGNLVGLALPTLGKYEWDYQEYTFPHRNSDPMPFGGIQNPPENMNITSGLSEQRLLDAVGTTKLAVTQYATRLFTPSDIEHADVVQNSVTIIANPSTGTVASKTLNYFTPASAEAMTQKPQPDPNAISDVGNPRTAGGVTRYLSSKTYDSSNHLVRVTYLVYDDPYRVGSQEVVTYGYDPVTASALYLNSTRTDYSDFDGYGHYRTVTTSGDFAGDTTPRTVTTTYNKNDPDVGASMFDSGTFDPITGILPWPESTPWILNMYSSVTASDGTGMQKSLACFDTATGFLLRARTMLGTTPQTHDIIAQFTPDAGNVGSEEYFGGDDGAAQGDIGAVPTSPLCGATLNTSSYPRKFFISHHYTAGSLDKTSYLDPACSANCTSILDTVDRTIDAGTGLPSFSRDPSLLSTGYAYDPSGRISSVTPPGDLAATGYTYTPATINNSTFVPASVTVQNSLPGANGLTSVYTYDALGRLILESIMGAGVPRYRTTAYDALGRKTSVSTLDTTISPSHGTSYVYDVLDRPLTVTEPDGSVTSFDYVSEASTTKRTVTIYTATGDTAATTKELHDRQNRLASVVEPNGTVTTYTYDIADHLTSVSMPGEGTTQHRYFGYDGRGFLQSEQHPELGVTGDGMTTYGEYDARGHARHKLTGSSGGTYDLSFTYDSAERLTSMSDVARGHLLKAFTFGIANVADGSATDYRKGKLLTAARYNHMPPSVSGDVLVTETYKYENTSGKPSECDTEVKNGNNTIQSFKQSFTYDSLGEVTAPGYPDCLSPVTCSAMPSYSTATNVYTNGLLTSVPGFATLTYNGNGTLGSVAHGNGVTDTIGPDTYGMPRPHSIDYAGWTTPTCTGPSTPSVSALSTQLPASNQGTTLTATATGCGTLSYQWYRGNSGDTSAPLGTGASYATGALQTTTNYWVRVTDSPSNTTADSATEVITVCNAAVITTQPQSTTLPSSNTGITLSVAASGCGTLTYQWYRGSSGDTSSGVLGAGTTYATGSLTSNTNFWVKVTDSQGSSANSNTAVVTIGCTPQITEQPLNQTVDYGAQVSVHVTVSGCIGKVYMWYSGQSGDTSTPLLGGYYNTPSITFVAFAHGPIWVQIFGDQITAVNSTTAMISVRPISVNAHVTSGTTINISWQAWANHYVLKRCSNGACAPLPALPTSASYTDTTGSSNTTYVYSVASVDVYGDTSPFSVPDLATTMTFTPVQTGAVISRTHINELLTGVNLVRAAAGQTTPLTWAGILPTGVPPPPSAGQATVPVYAAHITSLRTQMDLALAALGIPRPPYTDSLTTPTPIKAIHFTELQSRTQ